MGTSAALQAARAELTAQITKLHGTNEGFFDFGRVADDQQNERDMREASLAVVKARSDQTAAVEALLGAMDALEQTNYPDVPKLKPSPELYAKFKANRDSIDAAFADIEPPAPPEPNVAGGTVTFGSTDQT